MEYGLRGKGVRHLNFVVAGLDQPERLSSVMERSQATFISRMGLAVHPGPWPTSPAPNLYVEELDSSALRLLRRRARELATAAPS